MEVKYEINRMDIWKFNRYQFIKRPILRNLLIVVFLLFLFMTVSTFIKNGMEGMIPLIINLLFIILFYHLMKWIIMRTPSAKGGILGEHYITLNEYGLTERTKVNENNYKWMGIYGVDRSKEYILIYTDNMSAHVIPTRFFCDEEEAEHFYLYAHDLWKKKASGL